MDVQVPQIHPILFFFEKNSQISIKLGSHKTDTLIKCAIRDLYVNSRPILFLTLVGSVTFEIKTRLEARLGIKIAKSGISNHYVGYHKGIPICISNVQIFCSNHFFLLLKFVSLGQKL